MGLIFLVNITKLIVLTCFFLQSKENEPIFSENSLKLLKMQHKIIDAAFSNIYFNKKTQNYYYHLL